MALNPLTRYDPLIRFYEALTNNMLAEMSLSQIPAVGDIVTFSLNGESVGFNVIAVLHDYGSLDNFRREYEVKIAVRRHQIGDAV